jgi:hypothetical protein
MPNIIRITDLSRPELNEVQRNAIAYGETLKIDFSEQAILAAAMQRTGLENFGGDDFLERLSILREDWGGDDQLYGLHKAVLQGYLIRYASNRLLIQDTLNKNPEILEQHIEKPVIVVGLPRSGTTHLVNLLAADQRFHSLPLWESYEPVKNPLEASAANGVDPRFARCAEAWKQMEHTMPLLAAMHPMNPEHIHEELELMGPDFASYNFEWLSKSERWRDHYYATDQTPHYEYSKNVLRLLQWQRGGEGKRWVLKCPQHLEQLPALMRVFPDASIAITHRDPVAVIQSAVTMVAYGERMRRRTVDTRSIINYWADRIEHLLRACVRDRQAVPASRSLDILFHDFMANDMAVISQIYEKAGLDLTETARGQIEQFVRNHPRGKEGRMVYDLQADFGVDPAALRERFKFYFDQFPVRAEN